MRRGKIGGPNNIVQVDECKIWRQKYHRGRVVEGNWILGMIDINTKEVDVGVGFSEGNMLASRSKVHGFTSS